MPVNSHSKYMQMPSFSYWNYFFLTSLKQEEKLSAFSNPSHLDLWACHPYFWVERTAISSLAVAKINWHLRLRKLLIPKCQVTGGTYSKENVNGMFLRIGTKYGKHCSKEMYVWKSSKYLRHQAAFCNMESWWDAHCRWSCETQSYTHPENLALAKHKEYLFYLFLSLIDKNVFDPSVHLYIKTTLGLWLSHSDPRLSSALVP